jgi:hypothetical protein
MPQQIVVHKPAAQNTTLQSLLVPWREAFELLCMRMGYDLVTYTVDQHDSGGHQQQLRWCSLGGCCVDILSVSVQIYKSVSGHIALMW